MVQLKACPRCEGDLVLRYDPFEDVQHYNCIQCGYYRDVPEASITRAAGTKAEDRTQPRRYRSAA